MSDKFKTSFPAGHIGQIMLMENAIEKDICETIVAECKKYYSKLFSQGRTIGGYNDLMKSAFDFEYGRTICERLNVPYDVFARCEDAVIDSLYSAVGEYIQEYPMLWDWVGINDTGFRLQHYVKNFGYYRMHQDGGAWAESPVSRRVLGVVIYLNDVENGGETSFPEHDVKVPARAGSIVVFPASWTHPHCGRVSISGDKWIISTFMICNREREYDICIEDVEVTAKH